MPVPGDSLEASFLQMNQIEADVIGVKLRCLLREPLLHGKPNEVAKVRRRRSRVLGVLPSTW